MTKHILSISLLLLCLVLPRHADARLTLGAVADATYAGAATEQVETFAAQVAEKLGEEVMVKWLADSDALLNWLDRFAALDLALISSDVLEKNRGRFLVVGPLAQDSSVNLVVRQGVPGDVPKRLADLVSGSGLSRWRTVKPAAPSPAPGVSTERAEPSVVAPVRQLGAVRVAEHLPVEAKGRAWEAGEAVSVPEIQPEPAMPMKKLVLGVVPEPTGLIRTTQQAEEFAAHLEASLPVAVTVREFSKLETFTEWFMRYRMVDIAVISPQLAMLNLGRDYMPVAKLYRTDKPGPESAELVVMRSGHDEALQAKIQQVLLELPKTSVGQQRMAALQISDIFAPGLDRVAAPEPVEVAPVPLPPEEETPEIVEEVTVQEKVPDLPEPVEPEVPVTVPVPESPEVVAVEPATVPALPEMPEPVTLPADKAEDIVAETLLEETAPQQPAAPVEPGPVALPIVTPLLEKPPALPVVSTPELPVFPEGLSSPAQKPILPDNVAAVEIAPARTPQEVAAVPVMPGPPELPETALASEVPDVTPPPEVPDIEVVEKTISDIPVVEPSVEVPKVPEPVKIAPPAIPPVVAQEGTAGLVEEPVAEVAIPEEKSIIEEVLEFAEPVSPHELQEKIIVLPDGDDTELTEQDLVAVLGEEPVASMVAQPDLPQELRPTGIPMVRPGKAKPGSEVEEELLVASLPEPIAKAAPPKPPRLLPESEPEPGIVYVVPFVSVMIPQEVSSGIFDKFIDMLNQQGETLGLQFLILKEGLQRVAPEWLAMRKYVTGELYAYVEDRGATSTDLRSKARMTYREPNQEDAAFGFEYPVRSFFDHDHSTIEIERIKMANNIAETLASELINALQN
jgi:ABC-type phosphate/phosphonate transport system substrate-binding protein